MKNLQEYITESSAKIVKNYKLNKHLKQNGLEKITQCKENS